MTYHHYFEPRALKEYTAALKWYKNRSKVAAENFVKEMETAIAVICGEPFRYRVNYQQFREVSLKKYPFYLIYSIEEAKYRVLIFSVYHHKRNPARKFQKK